MKRFLLFAGDVFYPSGGFVDFIGDFEALEDAKDKLIKWIGTGADAKYLWAHIYDSETMAMVYEL